MSLFHTENSFLINDTTVTIRLLTEKDLPALEWEGAYTHFRKLYAQHYKNMSNGNTLIWVAQTNSLEIIGQIFILLFCQQNEIADGINRAYMFSFRIKPVYRNFGLGTFMLSFVEEEIKSRGFRQIRLNVARTNTSARRLYEKNGYRVIGPDPGIWSYIDHLGKWQTVKEPAWKMIKELG